MLDHEIILMKQACELHRSYARRELFPMKRTFAGSDQVGFTRSVLDQDFSSRFHYRNLDLRLSTGNSCYNDDDDDDDELNLSLSIGRSSNKKSKISRKSWKDTMEYTSSRDIIDLEESIGTRLNEKARQNCTPDVAILHQDHLKVDPCMMNSGMHQEWTSFNQGSNGIHDIKRKILVDFDLNKAQPDESSFYLNEPLGPYPSSDGSYGESCSKISTSIPMSKQPKSQTNAKDSSYGESCSKISTSIPMSKQPKSQTNAKDSSYGESCSKISTSIPMAKQPKSQTNAKDSSYGECCSKMSTSIPMSNQAKSQTNAKDSQTNAKDSSYGESCSKISTSIPMSKQPKSQTNAKDSQTKIFILDLESLPEPSSDLTEEQEESDYSVQKAALSLLSISLQQTSTSYQDSETKLGSNKIENIQETEKKTIPRTSSIDSYESLVLKLEESSIEEDSATSKVLEVNELDQKESGIKLRRGRRLKDFQKDILPTLSSLTRHEIWEDINILEGVIRSREYKRLHKAKTNKGEKWLTPVKNKRSKVKYVGQKCSSRKRK